MKRLALALLILIAGCGPERNGLKEPHPKYPPRYPRSEPTAIDTKLQARAAAEWAAAFEDNDEVMRIHAIEIVKDIDPADAEQRLRVALGDRSSSVRSAACFAIGDLKLTALKDRAQLSYAVLDQLPADASNDQHIEATQERIAAIYAQTSCGDFSHSHELEKFATDDTRPLVEREAVTVLGLLGNKSALELLFFVQHNAHDKQVKVQAAEAAWRLGSRDGLKGLVAGTISGDPSVQMESILALAEPGDTSVIGNIMGHVADDQPDGYFEVGLMATRACGMLGSDIGYGMALQGVESSDWRQRVLTAAAFAAIGRSDAQPYLEKLLDDKNKEVRIAAASALLKLNKKSH